MVKSIANQNKSNQYFEMQTHKSFFRGSKAMHYLSERILVKVWFWPNCKIPSFISNETLIGINYNFLHIFLLVFASRCFWSQLCRILFHTGEVASVLVGIGVIFWSGGSLCGGFGLAVAVEEKNLLLLFLFLHTTQPIQWVFSNPTRAIIQSEIPPT